MGDLCECKDYFTRTERREREQDCLCRFGIEPPKERKKHVAAVRGAEMASLCLTLSIFQSLSLFFSYFFLFSLSPITLFFFFFFFFLASSLLSALSLFLSLSLCLSTSLPFSPFTPAYLHKSNQAFLCLATGQRLHSSAPLVGIGVPPGDLNMCVWECSETSAHSWP